MSRPERGACWSPKCGATLRWVRTLAGVDVPVDVTTEPGGPLIAVIAAGGNRRVDRRRPADGDHPGFVPHWQTCPDPGAYVRERAEYDAGVPGAPAGSLASQLGPCAGCYRPGHIVYGPACRGLLCPACVAILAAWRLAPAAQRGPLRYPRWKGSDR